MEISSLNAKELNENFKDFFKIRSNTNYILKGNTDKLQKLKRLLDAHEIHYSNAGNNKTYAYSYQSNKNESLQTYQSDLLISSNQPKGKLVDVFLSKMQNFLTL